MPGWSQRPLFKNPTNMTGGGPVGMPKGMSIPGYQDGNVVEEMPTYRREQLAKEAEYQKAIEKAANLFSSSDPNRPRLLRDYESNLHWYAKNIAGGHQVPKEQVMQDLMKAIEAQRGQEEVMLDPRRLMPEEEVMLDPRRLMPEEEVMLDPRRLMPEEEVMLDPRRYLPPEMMHGGIVGLQNGGMMPELFEGEEIVETNPMINAMAGQGGAGIASVSAEPASGAMPERGVPNERGIIELAMDAEEVEDDEPMVAMAKQEAQSRLDEEFNILKSTAQAEASQGRDPSFIIKESMDSLARSANVIEQEVIENTPEIPTNTNLLSSEDLEPYQQELVAVFEMPEIGGEEPLMDTSILTAKNGGLIPGYQDGDVVLPPEWAWIDEDIRGKGLSLEESEREMIQRYGSDITAMRKILRKDRETSPREKEKIKRGRSLEELTNMDTRETDLITAMKEMGFEIASQPSIFQRKQNRTMDIIKNPEVKKLIEQYRAMVAPKETVVETENGAQSEQEAIAAYAKAIEDGTETPAWAKKVLSDALRETPENGGKEVKTTTDSVEVSPSPSPRSSSVDDLLNRIEGLGTKMELGVDTAKKDVVARAGDLTGVYDVEVKKSTDAVNAANTSINNALTSYEKRIPDLALLRAQSSGKPTFAQRRTLAKLYDTELRAGVDKTKIELGKLEKELQEARRENNLAASRDIKARQLDAINNLNELAIEQGVDLELNQLTTMLTHEMKLDEIRMQAELAKTSKGVQQALAEEVIDLQTRLATETDPTIIKQLKQQLTTYETVALGASSPKAAIEKAMAEGEYNNLFLYKSVDDIMEHASALQGEKTVVLGKLGTKRSTFPELYEFLVTQKSEGKNTNYTPKQIVEIWMKSGV